MLLCVPESALFAYFETIFANFETLTTDYSLNPSFERGATWKISKASS